MYYYELSIIKSPLDLLTYSSQIKLEPNTIVQTSLRNKSINAVIIQEVEKPEFKCTQITEENITKQYFDDRQITLAKFIYSS